MSEPTPPATPEISQEFFIRVNDFIEMANRIERRFDSRHASVAMQHAFARYSAYHFKTTTTAHDAANREAFADYVASELKQLVLSHIEDMLGPVPPVENPNDAAAE
jgi:hypothetical protein